MPTNSLGQSLKAAFCALLLMGLTACGEKPISGITAPNVIEAIRSGDAKVWDAVRSKKIRWPVSVVQVVMIYGDDFVKEFYLRFDPGFGAKAIAEVPINPSQAEIYKRGQAVTVTVLILSYEKENQTTIVKLGSGKVELAP